MPRTSAGHFCSRYLLCPIRMSVAPMRTRITGGLDRFARWGTELDALIANCSLGKRCRSWSESGAWCLKARSPGRTVAVLGTHGPKPLRPHAAVSVECCDSILGIETRQAQNSVPFFPAQLHQHEDSRVSWISLSKPRIPCCRPFEYPLDSALFEISYRAST